MADLDVLSEHAKSLLDGMVVDIVNVQQQLKALPAAMARMLAEQTQQLNAISATHVQRLTELSITQRDAHAAVLAQGIELLNNIVNAAKEVIEGQSKKECNTSLYAIKKLRDDAIEEFRVELGKVDGMVEGINKRLDPALSEYQEKLGEAAVATADYCNTSIVDADHQSATRLEKAAASVVQRMAQGISAQMWAFVGFGAVVWLVAGGVGAWAVAKTIVQ